MDICSLVNQSLAHSRRPLLAWLLLLSLVCVDVSAQEEKQRRKVIVCSTTQVADFARQVVGDDWVVRCVLAPGRDPHQYETTPNDVTSVRDADLCLANGMHLEGADWMKTLAEGAGKPLVNCTDGILPLQIKETIDGEQVEVPDPHAWFTPKNAAIYVRNILRATSQLDPDNASKFEARTKLYLAQLRALHSWIQQEVNVLPLDRRILVTSHDAFGYFCQEYGFKSAAPEGWSTGDEIGAGATPERRRMAVESIRKFNVKAIFVETSVNPVLIESIATDAGVEVGGELYSDSMGPGGSAGETYLGMMRENVVTIVEALK